MRPLRKKTKPNPKPDNVAVAVAETNDQADENHRDQMPMPTPATTEPATESPGNATDAVKEDAPTPLKGVKNTPTQPVSKLGSRTTVCVPD